MVCTVFLFVMLGLFVIALKLPLLIAIVHWLLKDPETVAANQRRAAAVDRGRSATDTSTKAEERSSAISSTLPVANPDESLDAFPLKRGSTTADVPTSKAPSVSDTHKPAPAAAKAASPAKLTPAKKSSKTGTNSPPKGMRRDDQLGLVFTSAPGKDAQDDLTKIKGVASVLEGKLHDFGVFTYRQIAEWDDDMVTQFGERLSFKDRIGRDQWREQCEKLHEEKYGNA